MQRPLTAIAAMSALAFALTASPASASPMLHGSFPATEEGTITCGPHTYVFTSGSFRFVSRDTTVGAHITAVDVWAKDGAGTVYRVVGTETYADPTRLVSKLRFVGQGEGIVDSVNIVGHLSPNGSFHFFDFGACDF